MGSSILPLITDFVHELRAAGVPVSMVEAIDATNAIRHVDLGERDQFKTALAATMVKNARHIDAFDTAFEVFFAHHRSSPMTDDSPRPGTGAYDRGGEGGIGGTDNDALLAAILAALGTQDLDALRSAVRNAVDRLAGMEPGRPVGGTYYLYRTMRQLDEDQLRELLLADGDALSGLDSRLHSQEVEELLELLRNEVASEIRRRLVADRGREAVAKTLRKPLAEDIELMHATRQELEKVEQVIEPLTRKLAARLARRRKLRRTGRLDVRKTMRRSMAFGGVPMEPVFRSPKPIRPELILLCDISGSMATFARFTLQFVYAMSSQFSRVRAFVFIDTIDEVTDYFGSGTDFSDALLEITNEADVVWLDGHSDYGHTLERFLEVYSESVTPRSTVIVTGDARNNYRPALPALLGEIRDSARALYWLNPEPRGYWGSGDSVMSQYAEFSDAVFEVRNVRQLEDFVESVALPVRRPKAAIRP